MELKEKFEMYGGFPWKYTFETIDGLTPEDLYQAIRQRLIDELECQQQDGRGLRLIDTTDKGGREEVKSNHVWVVEKLKKDKWTIFDVADYMTNKVAAQDVLRQWRTRYETEKFRLRKYVAQGRASGG